MYENPQFDTTPYADEVPYNELLPPEANETRRQLEACFHELDRILTDIAWTEKDIVATLRAVESGVTDDMERIMQHLRVQATLVEFRPQEKELWDTWVSGTTPEEMAVYYDDASRHSVAKLQMQLANLVAKLCRQEQ